MNWDAIGAVGEVVGATGVIISLLYMAYQIRQSRLALKSGASADASTSLRALTEVIMSDSQQTELFLTGLRDPDSMTEAQRDWAIQLTHALLRQFETLHFQFTNGALDQELFTSYKRGFAANLKEPLGRAYWDRNGHLFTKRFQLFVDEEGFDVCLP